MTEEHETRFSIETTDNFYTVSGYVVSEGQLVFSEGGEDVVKVPLDEVLSIHKEEITRLDVTNEILSLV